MIPRRAAASPGARRANPGREARGPEGRARRGRPAGVVFADGSAMDAVLGASSRRCSNQRGRGAGRAQRCYPARRAEDSGRPADRRGDGRDAARRRGCPQAGVLLASMRAVGPGLR